MLTRKKPELTFISKGVATYRGEKYNETARPKADISELYYSYSVSKPYYYGNRNLYNLAEASDVFQIIINSLNGEIFRNGFEIDPLFVKKCTNPECGKEFRTETKLEECDECHEPLRYPSESERREGEKFALKNEYINKNKQTLSEVCVSLNTDLERVDDLFALLDYDYYYDPTETIVHQTIKEILRVHPLTVSMQLDNLLRIGRTEEGKEIFVCPRHREIELTENMLINGRCPKCGGTVFNAWYAIGGTSSTGKEKSDKKFYASHEVIHASKYTPSLAYGLPPALVLYYKITALMAMDKFMSEYYTKIRSPTGIPVIQTQNKSSLVAAWKDMQNAVAMNPTQAYPLVFETSEYSKSDILKFVEIMRTPEEMKMIELRNEYYLKIGAFYQVTPIFMSDTGKGVGNEGLQVVVTNRAVQKGQNPWNNKVLMELSKAIGLNDWRIKLLPNEQRDELSDEQSKAQKIQNAMNMMSMGFQVSLKEDTEDLEFEYADADPLTRNVDPMGLQTNLSNTGMISPPQEQLFEGEAQHDHTSDNQRFEGESQDVKRSFDIKKNKVYLSEGETPPKGVTVQTGERGGKYYESTGRESSATPKPTSSKEPNKKLPKDSDKPKSIVDTHNTTLSALEGNSLKLKLPDGEIWIGQGASYGPKEGGIFESFDGKVVYGNKKYIGKKITDIPKIKEIIESEYENSKKFDGGDFSKLNETDNRDNLKSLTYLYKSDFQQEQGKEYLMPLIKAYFENSKVKTKIDAVDTARHDYLRRTNREERILVDKLNKRESNDFNKRMSSQEIVNELASEISKTQKILKKENPSGKIILFRGVSGKYADNIKTNIKKGNITIPINNLSSWTSDKSVAEDFAKKGGVILKKEISIDDIAFSHKTTPFINTIAFLKGGKEESEFVIMNREGKINISPREIL